ncbi:MAG: cytidine deaminase [Pseudomonadota bacterium]|jgi:cytidine deaminase
MADADFSGGYADPATAARLQAASGLAQGPFLRSLIDRAKMLAHPVLSGFRVGAVGLGESGAIYLGTNIEFPASQLCQTIHAEQAVVISAVTHGENRLAALAISAAPCGSCRQFLQELADTDNLAIWLARDTPYTLAHFLPDAFGPHDLGVTGGLLAPTGLAFRLRDAPAKLDPAVQAALEAANKSYAPYTKAYAGCALVAANGSIHTGSAIENAAFNPSLTANQAAMISLILAGHDWQGITSIVLAQTPDGIINHRQAATQMIASLGLGIVPRLFELATAQEA